MNIYVGGIFTLSHRENEICFLLYMFPQELSKSRVRRQNPPAQNGQLIDNIFNVSMCAI